MQQLKRSKKMEYILFYEKKISIQQHAKLHFEGADVQFQDPRQ
jgi:hypothetical protein